MTTTSVLVQHSCQPRMVLISGSLRIGPYLFSNDTERALYEFQQNLAVANANQVAALAEEDAAAKRVYEGKTCMQVLEYRLERIRFDNAEFRRSLATPDATQAAAFAEEEAAMKRVQVGKIEMQMLVYRLARARERRKLVDERVLMLGNSCYTPEGATNPANLLAKKASLDDRIRSWGSEVAIALNQDTHPPPPTSATAFKMESMAAESPSDYHAVEDGD